MKKLLFVLFLSVFGFAAAAGAETVSRIVAVVNDDIITSYQLDQRAAARLAQAGQELSPEEMDLLRENLLGEMIEETLLNQRVKELGIEVGEEDVDLAIQDVLKQNSLTEEQLIQALESQGMPYDTYRDNMKKQIVRFRLIGVEVQSKVEVTTQEVRDYYAEHQQEYLQAAKVHLSRLSFPVPEGSSEVQKNAMRDQALQAQKRLAQGEDLYAVLLTYSAEAGAEGGDLGTFALKDLSRVFQNALEGVEEGQVSEVVEFSGAYHILKVDERTDSGTASLDEVRESIEKNLLEQKREQRFKEWSKDLREKAYIDKRL